MEVDLALLLAATTAYGATVTKIVDAIRKFDRDDDESRKVIWNVLPLLIGVLVAWLFDVNAVDGDGTNPIFGLILTGLAIGASASGWHEAFDAISGVAKKGHETAASLKAQ